MATKDTLLKHTHKRKGAEKQKRFVHTHTHSAREEMRDKKAYDKRKTAKWQKSLSATTLNVKGLNSAIKILETKIFQFFSLKKEY